MGFNTLFVITDANYSVKVIKGGNIMEPQTNVPLTASEMANLWASYNSNTMSKCVIRYFLANNGDADIRPVLDYALSLSTEHIKAVTDIFIKEKFPIPVGFNENDVNLEAPRLFSDAFYIDYLKNMGKVGITTYGFALSSSARSDIRSFYQECLTEASQLFQMAVDVALSKGTFVRDPAISVPQKSEFVTKKTFYGGFFGEQRPLTSMEIAHIFYNMKTNATGHTLLLGFSQTASDENVRKHLWKGKDMAIRHVTLLSGLLTKDDIPTPMSWAEYVTKSTTPPFSDKLMMFHTTLLIAASTGNYGFGIAASPRKDVTATYARLAVEAGDYAKDSSDLMIEKAWLEQPPQADDRKALSRI